MQTHQIVKKSPDNKKLLIAFNGYYLPLFTDGGPPIFENFKMFTGAGFEDYDVMFVCDSTRNWYINGVDHSSNSIPGSASWLQELAAPYERVTTFGVSAGGYAAILFGSLINADKIIAIAPQTDLAYVKNNISRYADITLHDYTDLKQVLNTTSRYHITYWDDNDTALPADPVQYHLHHIHHTEQLGRRANLHITGNSREESRRIMRAHQEIHALIDSL